jgi:hypothetical protein
MGRSMAVYVPADATVSCLTVEVVAATGGPEQPPSARRATAVPETRVEIGQFEHHIIDEADRLNHNSLQWPGRVAYRTEYAVTLVTLPHLVVTPPKLTGTLGGTHLPMGFDAPNRQKVLEMVLPQLAIPGW